MKIVESFRNTIKEFRSFALRANALDLAIGVSLGAAFTTVVHAIVTSLFTPLIAAVWGNVNVSTLSFQIHGTTFNYGQAVNGAVSLFIVAATLFFFVVKPLNGLRRRLGLDTSASLPKAPCPACFTEIDIRSKRCASCTESLPVSWSETTS
jgi:large conductance mechanosensitive channel